MHVFMTCQIDVVNKQLASVLSWNNPLWETLLGESHAVCRAELFPSISQGFSKTCIPLPCLYNSKKSNNQSFWIFFIIISILFISVYIFKFLPVAVSACACLNVTPEKSLNNLHCTMMKFSIKKFFNKSYQIRRNCEFGQIYWKKH